MSKAKAKTKFLFTEGIEVTCIDTSARSVIEIYEIVMKHNIRSSGDFKRNPYDSLYPYIIWNGDRITQSSTNYSDKIQVSKEQFIEQLNLAALLMPISLKLNDENEAVISDKEIKVGCQTFPISIIDQLIEARKQFIANQKQFNKHVETNI